MKYSNRSISTMTDLVLRMCILFILKFVKSSDQAFDMTSGFDTFTDVSLPNDAITSEPTDAFERGTANTWNTSIKNDFTNTHLDDISIFVISPTSEMPPNATAANTGKPRTDRIPLHLMGFSSININANGWSSAGVIPAIEMAIQDINDRDDILADYELILDLKDSQCNPGKSIQGFYQHISTPPTKIVILGGGCSVATVPVARTAPYFGLVQMAYSAASPELSQRGIFPTFFRTAMSDLAINKPIVSLLQHYNWRHIATIHEQNDMFSMTVNQLHYLLSEINVTLITAESFQISPTENIRNILRKDARIIFFNGYEGSARLVFCQVYRQNAYGAKFQWIIPGWYNTDWASVNDTICTPQQVRQAAMYALAVTDLKGDLSGLRTISGMTFDEYVARYEEWPSLAEYGHNGYHPNGYDAVWAVSLALNATATIIGSENTTVFENGTFQSRPKRLDDFDYGDSPEISAVIFASMTEISFHGVSGPVAFKLGERSAIVEVTQVQESGTVRIGVYTEASDKLIFADENLIKWHGDGPPKSALEPALVVTYKNNILVICACVLAGVGAVLAVLFLIFNIMNKDHAHIKMSSPRLNNLIVFGTILACSCVVLLGMDLQFLSETQMRHLCFVRKWVISVSFTFAFGAMFAKIWRVHVIFTRKFSLATKPVHDVHLIGFVFGLLLLDAGVLTAWTVVDPFVLEYRNVSTSVVNDFELIYQIVLCHCDNDWWWMGSLYLIKGLLLLFGCFLAWEIRNVTIPGFNDSKFVGVCVYNVIMCCLVGVTVTIALPERDDITYAFQAFCILFCTYTTLLVLFLPKIRHVLKHPEESAKNRKSSRYNGSTPSSTFTYTIKGIKRTNDVPTVTGHNGEDVDDNRTEITERLDKKTKEFRDLEKKYMSLKRTLRDMFLQSSENNGVSDGITLHIDGLIPKKADPRRGLSLSFPRCKKIGDATADERPAAELGFDNLAFC